MSAAWVVGVIGVWMLFMVVTICSSLDTGSRTPLKEGR